jgi:hypothetical protein
MRSPPTRGHPRAAATPPLACSEGAAVTIVVEARPEPGEVVVAHLPYEATLVVYHPDGRRSEHRERPYGGITPPASIWWVVHPAMRDEDPVVSSIGITFVRNDKHRLDRPQWHALARELRRPRLAVAYVAHAKVPYYSGTRLATVGYRIEES